MSFLQFLALANFFADFCGELKMKDSHLNILGMASDFAIFVFVSNFSNPLDVVFKSTITLSSWFIISALPFHSSPSISEMPGISYSTFSLRIKSLQTLLANTLSTISSI